MKRTRRAVAFVVTTIGAVILVAGALTLVYDPANAAWLLARSPFGDDDTRRGEPVALGAFGRSPLLMTLGDPAVSGLPAWPGPFDAVPTVFDIDGDGTSEVIAQSNDSQVYVFSTRTGRALAVLGTSYPPGWYVERVLNVPTVAVLRPGEPPSIVVTNHAAYVAVWRYVPGQSTESRFVFEKVWERRMNDCFWNPGMDAKAAVHDVDGDGTLEIFVQPEETGLFGLAADGSILWKHCWAGGNAAPIVADLNGGGKPEVIFASDDGNIVVLDARTGDTQWIFNAGDPRWGIRPASVSVSPTVAELDGKAPKELLFTARHAPSNDSAAFHEFHMAIFAVRQSPTTYKSELVWMRQPDWAHPLSYTHLVALDADADGKTDVFGMDWNTIGHMPGNWEPLGPAHVFRLDAQGQDVWVREIDSWWSNKDIMVADSDLDGAFEVYANGALAGSDGVWRLDAETGNTQGFLPTAPWKLLRGPIAVALYDEGTPKLLLPLAPDEASPKRGSIMIYDIYGNAGR